ncbi:hypothetical protein [Dyadobacter psychrotolerans]|uniref:J domain-containing protein n=1 Tax=Dyadobacter psychrotolerans TaxID=2541721 RepID=A0A4R5DUQ6_9BACT|nr:hypothetical protein [Dyadobacter psychrotolerans]TDE18232.1 hypothetical protein E0F88_01425 [Dyadobacter psychrotolerans]
MTNESLLRIGQPKSDLNKRQKEFNQLSEKIEQLDLLIPELKTARDEMISRIPTDLNPLIMEYQSFRVELVQVMDRTYEADLYRKAYLTKLSYLIVENAFDLIANYGFDELKPVFNKYSEIDIETALDSLKQKTEGKITDPAFLIEEEAQPVKEFPEHFHEWPEDEQQRFKEERRAERVQERILEAKQNLEKQKTTKSVRTVYMDLVKAFHPDRETDEGEKLRKTEIMQRVTHAYQENNLLGLLKLQIEFDRIDQDHLENLTKNQLNYYNKVLKQQVEELELEKEIVQKEISALCGLPYQHANSYTTAIVKFNTNVNEVKAEIKNIKITLKQWKIPSQLKVYLKTYEIPNETVLDEDED